MAEQEIPLSLVVFAYNESENISKVLPTIIQWLKKRNDPWELIFVNDGSTDSTLQEVQKVFENEAHCQVISLPYNQGIGAALKAGVAVAKWPWITFLPCDGQIPVEELDVLLSKIKDDDRQEVALVLSIYRARDDGLVRKILSRGVRVLIRVVHGVWIQSDGPYLFRKQLFNPNVLKANTFFLNWEFPIRMLRNGIVSRVVVIECVPRMAGHSKSTGWKRVAGVMKDLLWLKVRIWNENKEN